MIKTDYEKYIEHYVQGAKKISVRSKTLQLNLKEIDLKVKKSFGNYDLFFNKVGKLMHSVHYENEHSSKVLYAYDENDLLLSELQLQSITNILISDKIFTYDEHDRIKSIMYKSGFTKYGTFDYEEEIHEYNGQNEIITFNKVEQFADEEFEEDDHEIFIINNQNQQNIEEKVIRNGKELVYWQQYEYDLNGQIRFEYSLNKDGKIDGVYTFLPEINGISTGFKYKSDDSEFTRFSEFQFNERGHWVSETSFLNGEPRYIYERIIDYW
jgi:hypothetical protein